MKRTFNITIQLGGLHSPYGSEKETLTGKPPLRTVPLTRRHLSARFQSNAIAARRWDVDNRHNQLTFCLVFDRKRNDGDGAKKKHPSQEQDISTAFPIDHPAFLASFRNQIEPTVTAASIQGGWITSAMLCSRYTHTHTHIHLRTITPTRTFTEEGKGGVENERYVMAVDYGEGIIHPSHRVTGRWEATFRYRWAKD